MKKIKRWFAICAILLISPMFIAATSAPKYQENTRINAEITQLIGNGTLPAWHGDYLSNMYYHKIYLKFKSSISYFAALSRQSLDNIISNYTSTDSNFIDIINNLSIPITDLKINQTIGIFYTGQTMQMIWTSEYIPHEGLNLKSVTVNSKTINQHLIDDKTCAYIDGDGVFEITFSYGFPTHNIQLNLTPIGGYQNCGATYHKYGFDVEQKIWKIEKWKAGMESVVHDDYPDPTGYYDFQCDDPVTFELAEAPKINSKAVSQLTSHQYIEIKEAEAQSIYDLLFGGYKHFVYFNTPIEMDAVYRVDCLYTLANDNKDWWQFWLNDKVSYDVQKSLTAKKNAAGLFNMFNYQGLTEGNYASNYKDKTFYKYKLHLNYSDSNWDLFSSEYYPESAFKRIQKFQILRLNYICHDEEFDVDVKMDTIQGDTFMIFDRGLIMSTSDPIWEFKEDAYKKADDISKGFGDFFGAFSTAIIVIISIAAGIFVLKIGESVYKAVWKKEK